MRTRNEKAASKSGSPSQDSPFRSEYQYSHKKCKGLIHSDTFSTSSYPRDSGHVYRTSGICVLNYFATTPKEQTLNPSVPPLPKDNEFFRGLVSCAALPVQESDLLLQHVESRSLQFEWSDPCIALETRCYDARELDYFSKKSLGTILGGDSEKMNQVAFVSLDCTDDHKTQTVETLMGGWFGEEETPSNAYSPSYPTPSSSNDAALRGTLYAVVFFIFMVLAVLSHLFREHNNQRSRTAVSSTSTRAHANNNGMRSYELRPSITNAFPVVAQPAYHIASTTSCDDNPDGSAAALPVAVAAPLATTITTTNAPPHSQVFPPTSSSSSSGSILYASAIVLPATVVGTEVATTNTNSPTVATTTATTHATTATAAATTTTSPLTAASKEIV